MALTVSSRYIYPPNFDGTPPADDSGFRKITILLTGIGNDSTNESNVVKIDLSTLKNIDGIIPTNLVLERISWIVAGFNYITLSGDHTVDTVLAILPAGQGLIEHDIVDSGSGGTGDILLSTDNGSDGDSYSIVITARLQAV